MTSKKELKDSELYDTFSLLPRRDGSIKKPRSTDAAREALIVSMDVRRLRNERRKEDMKIAEERTAFLQPEKIVERTMAEGQAKLNDIYEEHLNETTLRGDHIFRDVHQEFLESTLLESELYQNAADLIKYDRNMREGFTQSHANRMEFPEPSKEHVKEIEERAEFVEFTGPRIEASSTARKCHNDIRHLIHSINDMEDEVAEILFEVDEYKDEHDFDWQLLKQSRVRELRKTIAKHQTQLYTADKILHEVVAKVQTEFPDLKNTINADDAGASAELVKPDSDISVAYGWVLGRLTVDGKVCTIFYGQFTESLEPPDSEWMFLGRNINQSLRNTKPVEASAIDKSDESVSATSKSDGVNFTNVTVESAPSAPAETKTGGDRVRLLESEMYEAKDDRLLVSPATVSVNKSINQNASVRFTDYYRVGGCSIQEINGRYLEWGKVCDAPRYRNVKGWVLFRTKLHEIPELGIYVDGCYNAFRGPSVTELLRRRSEVAYRELLLFGSGIDEGSAKFKRRFAEISRTGNKFIITDQTEQLARDNEYRAKVRSKNNEEMLELIQGTAGRGDDQKDDGDDNISLTDGADDLLSVSQSMSESSSQVTQGTVAEALLEVKVTMAKNTNFQKGSQGFVASKNRKFLEREAELSREVVGRIETRESLIKKAKLDAAWVQKQYLESEWDGSATKGSDAQNGAIFDLLESIRAVRNASVDVLEAIGAWTRLTKLEQNRKSGKAGRDVRDLNKTYCVVIASKGPVLYPQSKEITSGARRFRRGLEEPKQSIITKYIGEYKDKTEAMDAFGIACSSVPIEQRPFAYSDNPPMFVGLRNCRKHYLVRSEGVPSDLPCEQCATRDYSKPNTLVKTAKAEDSLPQFLWHGNDYIEKMTSDMSFLQENVPLQRRVPELSVKGNPLLLLRHNLKGNLDSLSVSKKDTFNQLRGRKEQLSDALEAGEKLHKESKEVVVNATTTAYLGMTKFERQIMNRPEEESKVKTPLKKETEYTVLSTLRPLEDTEDSDFNTTMMNTNDHPSTEDGSPPRSPATSDVAVDLGQSINAAFFDTTFNPSISKEINLLTPEMDEVNMERLNRALSIIYQSAKYNKNELDKDLLPESVKASALTRRPMQRPDLTKNLTSLERFMEKAEKLDMPRDPNALIATETNYTYRGAILTGVQMRPPAAYRDDQMWCRGDKGEWSSMSKGRNVRSWEFQDNMVQEGRRRAAERKTLQMEIRKECSVHVVDCHVSRINELIFKAAQLRGNVLQLDILQAESFLAYRQRCIKAATSTAAIYRAIVVRRMYRKMRDEHRWKLQHLLLTEQESAKKASSLVSTLLDVSVKRVKHSICKWMFVGVMNINGVSGVASLHIMNRGLNHSMVLCESCQGKSTTLYYQPATRSVKKIRGACTCKFVEGRERWFLRMYDPLSRKCINTILNEYQVREAIRELNRLSNETLKLRKEKLIGKNFDKLRWIFSDMTNASKAAYSLRAIASLEAAKEGSTLPKMPTFITDRLLQSIEHPHETPATGLINLAQTNYYSSAKPLPVYDMYAHGDEMIASENRWQPFYDLRNAQIQYERARHHCDELSVRIKNSEDSHSDGVITLANQTLELERLSVSYEDARMKYLVACEALDANLQRVKDAMAFQKRSIEAFDGYLDGQGEDFDGLRDRFLDGNNYQGLNMRRRLEAVIVEWRAKMNERYILVQAQIKERIVQMKKLEYLHEHVLRCKEELIVYRPVIPYIEKIIDYTQLIIKEAGNAIIRIFSLPRLPGPSGKRQLRRRNTDLIYVRDPIARAKVEYRANWVFMSTKVQKIMPWDGPCNTGTHLLSSVSYYIDNVTGYHLLVLGTQDVAGFEEALMHTEFLFEPTTFTKLVGVTPQNEMLLRPEDVQEILDLEEKTKRQLSLRGFKKKSNRQDNIRKSVESSIKVIETRKDKLAYMEHTLNSRRRKQVAVDFAKVKRVLDQLHLQWFTGRPCLGTVYFQRRINHATNVIRDCLWYKDIIKGNPSTNLPISYHAKAFISGKVGEVIVRSCWGDIELNLLLNDGRLSVNLIVDVADVMLSMVDKPGLLCAFLYEMILNQFSTDSVDHIIKYTDLQLPGERTNLWRAQIHGEIPTARYVSHPKDRFRGPALITHRFLWGKYLSARFMRSSIGDIRIEIGAPINGQFWIHAYAGTPIIIEISIGELRTFVRRLCADPDLVPPRFVNNLDILHSFYHGSLFELLLDSLTLNFGKGHHDDPDKVHEEESGHQSRDEVSIVNSVAEETWLDRACHRFLLGYRRFNHWATKTYGKVPNLKPKQLALARKFIEGLKAASSWHLEVHKHNRGRNFVDIYQGLWMETHAESFYRNDVEAAFNTITHRYFNGRELFTRGHHSYWKLRVLTDDGKRRLYIKIRPSDYKDSDVQDMLMKDEGEEMAAEDELSRRINIDEEVTLHHKQELREVQLLERKLKAMVKLLKSEEIKAAHFGDCITHARDLLVDSVDGLFKGLAYSVFMTARSSAYVPPPLNAHHLENVKPLEVLYPCSTIGRPIGDLSKVNYTDVLMKGISKSMVKMLHHIEYLRRQIIELSGHELPIHCIGVQESGVTGVKDVLGHPGQTIDSSNICDLHKKQKEIKKDNRNQFRKLEKWRRLKRYKVEQMHNRSNIEDVTRDRTDEDLGHKVNALCVNERLCLISNPRIGPFDIISFDIYEPRTKIKWVQTVVGAPTLPFHDSSSSVLSSSGANVDPNDDIPLNVKMAKICAERIVSVSLMLGAASASVRTVENITNRRVEVLKLKIAEVVSDLVDKKLDLETSVSEASFPSRFKEISVQNMDILPYSTRLCAIFMPAEEEIMPTPYRITADKYRQICEDHMSIDDLERIQTVPFIMYKFANGKIPIKRDHDRNQRVMDWMDDYVQHIGWKEGYEKDNLLSKFKVELKNGFSQARINVYGDCILLLRHGESDLEKLIEWFTAREAILGPIREAERERKRTEGVRRRNNHNRYRNLVIQLAEKYLPYMEQIFTFRHEMRFKEKFKHYHVRPLHARALYLDFAALLESEKPQTILIKKNTFLVDRDIALEDPRMSENFDGESFDEFVQNRLNESEDSLFDWSLCNFFKRYPKSNDENNHILDPNKYQVFYTAYIIHCRRCACTNAICKFPGCRLIKEFVQLHDDDQHEEGSGRDLIELGVRNYFLNGPVSIDFRRDVYQLNQSKALEAGPDPYWWDLEQARLTRERKANHARNKYLTVFWRTADHHALQFRFANRYIVRPEMKAVVSAHELVEVTGGQGYIDQKRMHATIPREKNDVYDMLPSDINKDVNLSIHEDDTNVITPTAVEMLFEMRMTFVRNFLGSGTSIHGKTIIPQWAIDPYPMNRPVDNDNNIINNDNNDKKSRYPMSPHLFNWISSRLHIAPVETTRQPAMGAEHYALQFNRKYNEEVQYLNDGSLVIIQILFGVVADGMLRSDLEHGCPSAARQFCNINDVNSLIPGLTISIYDIRSDVSKAIKLYDKQLARFANVIDAPEDDLPQISQKFLEVSPIILRIDRVGKLCTAISIDPSGLKRAKNQFKEVDMTATGDTYRYAGSSQIIMSTRNRRLQKAMKRNGIQVKSE